jgi:sulfofructose kinase
MAVDLDVLCVGHACYDLVFAVERHPGPNEKVIAARLVGCGGGPAANAAVAAARLGCRAAFAGYLGNDLYGQTHFKEFLSEGVFTGLVERGESPTPLSAILVKPDGARTVVNYRGSTAVLPSGRIDFSPAVCKIILFDGHEPNISLDLINGGLPAAAVTVLDAGSVHRGTRELVGRVDYVVASEKFARDYTGEADHWAALAALAQVAPAVIVTRGEKGLIWQHVQHGSGRLDAFDVAAVDTTGAGDAFHGAFCAGLAGGKSWPELLRYACAVAALSCTKEGARPALPAAQEVADFLSRQ